MKYRVRYAYYNLGEQQEGSTAVVHLRGSAANVILVDKQSFARYRAGRRDFRYKGGLARRSPVRLEVPHESHWYVVVDLGGFGGRVQASVEVLNADGSRQEHDSETTVVEAKRSSRKAERPKRSHAGSRGSQVAARKRGAASAAR